MADGGHFGFNANYKSYPKLPIWQPNWQQLNLLRDPWRPQIKKKNPLHCSDNCKVQEISTQLDPIFQKKNRVGFFFNFLLLLLLVDQLQENLVEKDFWLL